MRVSVVRRGDALRLSQNGRTAQKLCVRSVASLDEAHQKTLLFEVHYLAVKHIVARVRHREEVAAIGSAEIDLPTTREMRNDCKYLDALCQAS